MPQTERMMGPAKDFPMRLFRLTILLVAAGVVLRAQPAAITPDSLGVPELLAQFKVPAVSVAVPFSEPRKSLVSVDALTTTRLPSGAMICA